MEAYLRAPIDGDFILGSICMAICSLGVSCIRPVQRSMVAVGG